MTLPEGWKAVPIMSTEDQWGGLARDLVMWMQLSRNTGKALHTHLRCLGRTVPAWLLEEIPNIDHAPPKGTIAQCIYRAMVEAAPEVPE